MIVPKVDTVDMVFNQTVTMVTGKMQICGYTDMTNDNNAGVTHRCNLRM